MTITQLIAYDRERWTEMPEDVQIHRWEYRICGLWTKKQHPGRVG